MVSTPKVIAGVPEVRVRRVVLTFKLLSLCILSILKEKALNLSLTIRTDRFRPPAEGVPKNFAERMGFKSLLPRPAMRLANLNLLHTIKDFL